MSIMIRLEHIKRKNDSIICNAFVEDCKESIALLFRLSNNELDDVDLPKEYEWCSSHLAHARKALEQMAITGEIKDRVTIIWC